MHIGGDVAVASGYEHESGKEAAAAGGGGGAPASCGCEFDLGQANTAGEPRGKFAGAERKRPRALKAQRRHGLPERRACSALCSGLQKEEKAGGELRLRVAIVDLSRLYPRHGHRRTAAFLQADGWRVNHKRVAQIRHEEGLQFRQRMEKCGPRVSARRVVRLPGYLLSESCLEL